MRTLRIVLVVLVALLAWLQYRLWFGSGGNNEVAELQAQVEQQARQNDGLRERNAALAAEVADLKSGEAAIEERARSERWRAARPPAHKPLAVRARFRTRSARCYPPAARTAGSQSLPRRLARRVFPGGW